MTMLHIAARLGPSNYRWGDPPDQTPKWLGIRHHRRVSIRLTRHTLSRVLEVVASRHGLTPDEVLSQRRTRRIAYGRQELMAELRRLRYSLPEIGRMLGKDHTTVLHGVRAHERRQAA